MRLRDWTKNILFLVIYLFSGGALMLIIDGLSTGTELTPFNTAIEAVMVQLRTPLLTNLMIFVTNIGSPYMLSALAIFLAIYLLLKGDTYDAILYLASIVLAIISFVVLKDTFQFTRPTDSLLDLTTWSFPSGHATVSTAFFFSTGYTFFGRFKNAFYRIGLVLLCILGALTISFSRLYLGAHWALDVLAGLAIGLMAASLVLLVSNIFLEERYWKMRAHR